MDKQAFSHHRSQRPATAQAGHITLVTANPHSARGGTPVDRATVASSDRCLLNADGTAGSFLGAHFFTKFKLVGFIEERSPAVLLLIIFMTQVALHTSIYILALVPEEKADNPRTTCREGDAAAAPLQRFVFIIVCTYFSGWMLPGCGPCEEAACCGKVEWC